MDKIVLEGELRMSDSPDYEIYLINKHRYHDPLSPNIEHLVGKQVRITIEEVKE
jgi:hypothetical protein